MTTNLCPFVDDVVKEAEAIAYQLRQQGFPYEIQPAMPDITNDKTLHFIMATRPKAVILDFYMSARPHVKSDRLAAQLIHSGIPTVLVTKDRSISDEGSRTIRGISVPIYSKRSLISDHSTLARFTASLGILQSPPVASTSEDFGMRLSKLQDKAFIKALSSKEKKELKLLMARLQLIEREEVGQVEAAQGNIDANFSKLLETIKSLREEIDRELNRAD